MGKKQPYKSNRFFLEKNLYLNVNSEFIKKLMIEQSSYIQIFQLNDTYSNFFASKLLV